MKSNIVNKIIEVLKAYAVLPYKVEEIRRDLNELKEFVYNHITCQLNNINQRIDRLYEILVLKDKEEKKEEK